jgi:glycosyl transferase/beta-hydroxylase protein BlmF
MFKKICERLDIWDLLQLLAGHVFRYRHPGLQDIAAEHCLRPRASSAITLRIVNGSIRLRRWVRQHTYLRWRYAASRIRWAVAANPRQPIEAAAPVTTFSLLCPSRERVGNARSLIESVCRTAVCPQRVELLFYVDADDPSLAEYQRLFAEPARRVSRLKRCELIVGEPITVSRSWNVLARAAQGDVLTLANDDLVFVDYGWDERAAAELLQYPDGIVCMFFDAGQYLTGGDFPMVPRRWFEVLGYFTPEIFEFWQNELWMMDIAERAGRLHPVKGILVDHLHYFQYLSPFDETYRRHRLTRDKSQRDNALFGRLADLRESEAQRLRQLIDRDRVGSRAPGSTPCLEEQRGEIAVGTESR